MHVDLDRAGEDRQAQAVYRSTYCIVGGGIAGLILARRLASAGASVHLLEAGGLEFEERSQSLYAAEMPHRPHSGTTAGRFRTLGGSSTRWGGQLLPYTPDIFRPASPNAPAWPLTERDLQAYYPEIEQLMHAGSLPFDERLLESLGQPRPSFSPGLRVRFSKWAPFRRRNLAHTLGPECLAHPDITVFTHANVAELQGSETPAAKIESARVLNYAGQEFRFEADVFVIAAGVVESARLLLLSLSVPNPYDQTGRYFHDHLSFHAASIPPEARPTLFRQLGPFFAKGVLHTPKLEATPEMQQEHGLLAVMAHFVIEEPEDSGIAALRGVLTALQRRTRITPGMLLSVLRGTGDVLRLLWSTNVGKRRAVSRRATVWLNIDMEQPPRAESRIHLAENRDALGLRKAVVHWSVGDSEQQTALRFSNVIRGELERAGFPPLAWSEEVLAGRPPELADTFHAMGGLRMGTDPRSSVVDADLKVHGTDNLYVASCAVYPSGGSSNPTFTLMALTLRLADHLLTTHEVSLGDVARP